MTFKFHCACGQKVSATDDMIGTSAVCPRCGSKIVVARPPELAEAAPTPPPPPATLPVTPLTVVPRPMGLLWLTTSLTLAVALGAGAFLFRGHLDLLAKNGLPILAGAPIGLIVGSAIFAVFLRLAVRIVGRFDLAFLEAWLVTLSTTALNLLALAPVALVQLRISRPEDGAKLFAITSVVSLLLTIVAYSYLIRNALGRPIGIGRGILTYLLQAAFVGLLIGILVGIAAVVWHRS